MHSYFFFPVQVHSALNVLDSIKTTYLAIFCLGENCFKILEPMVLEFIF